MTVTGENYKAAREIYARAGVDTDEALRLLNEIPVSIIAGRLTILADSRIRIAAFPAAYRQREAIQARRVQRKNL